MAVAVQSLQTRAIQMDDLFYFLSSSLHCLVILTTTRVIWANVFSGSAYLHASLALMVTSDGDGVIIIDDDHSL